MTIDDSANFDLEATHRLHETMWHQNVALQMETFKVEIDEMKKEYDRKFNLFRSLLDRKISFKAVASFLCIVAALITGSIMLALRAENRLANMVETSRAERIYLTKKVEKNIEAIYSKLDAIYVTTVENKAKLEAIKK